MASPKDSITEAMRKLPLSLTRLAACGVSPTTNVLCLEQGIGGVDRLASARGDDEELARFRDIWAAEYWSGDETLAGRAVVGTQPRGQSDADGARRNVDRALAEARSSPPPL
jgi:hypothetical protein